MTVDDLQAYSLVNPTCFKVHIKCAKTDPFLRRCDIYVGRGEGSVCPIRASMGADSCQTVCCFGACAGHVLALCLYCTRIFVSVAWRGILVA